MYQFSRLKFFRPFILLVLLYLKVTLLHAQSAPFNFLPFSVNEGLSQNSVWCLLRDSRGWLWAATSGGLTCRIGDKVKVYKQAKLDPKTIQGNNVNFVFEDKYGKVWIGNDGGVDVFDPITELFHKAYSFKHASPSGQRLFYYLTEPDSEHVWLGINNKSVYRFNMKLFKPVQEISNFFPKPFAFKHMIWSSVQNKRNAFLYFDNGNILVWDFKQHNMQVLPVKLKIGSGLYLYNDTCYLYTDGHIARLEGKQIKYVKRAPGLQVCRGVTYWNNFIVFGGEDGYILYNPLTKEHNYYSSFDPNKERTYCRIVSCYADRQGVLWLGTDGKGIFYHTPLQNRFAHIVYRDEENNMVKGLCIAEPNYLLHVVYGKGVMRYDLISKEAKLFYGERSFPQLKSLAFSAVCMATKPKHFWAAHTLSSGVCGLYRINYETGIGENFTHLVSPVLGKQDISSFNSYLDRHQNKAYLISNSSLIELDELGDRPSSKVVFYDTSLALSCFRFSHKGDFVLIGHAQGALAVDLAGKKKPQHLLELGKDLVKCIVQHNNGNYYLGSTNGVFVYDNQFKFIEKYTTKNGLTDNFVYGLLMDAYGMLWISHNKGLNRLDVATKKFQHFEAKDGLQSNEFNTNAFTASTSGRLYFGGVNGINSFDPKDFLGNDYPPQAFVRNVKVFDEDLTTDTSWSYRKVLSLPYTSNTISFEFGHNDIMTSDAIKFSYKLEGIDADWVNDVGKGYVRYPSLPFGEYVLKLKASDNKGNWSKEVYELQLAIASPFWQTWWFRLLIVLIIALLLSLSFLMLIRRNKQKVEREYLLQKRLEDERLRISRDLHDHVGAQLSYLITNIDWMLSHPQQMTAELEQARLKDLSETGKQAILTLRQTIWALHNKEITAIDFADKFKQFAQKMLAFSTQTKLQFEENFEAEKVFNPEVALSLFRVCQEALGNALKHANASLISIKFSCSTANGFVFEIKDNGKGFVTSEKPLDGHYGLENMKARAKECGAEISIETESGSGTRIVLVLN